MSVILSCLLIAIYEKFILYNDSQQKHEIIRNYCQSITVQNKQALDECDSKKMEEIVNLICDEADNEILKKNKNALIKHMKDMNGSIFASTEKEKFAEDFIKYKETNDKCVYKKDGILAQSFAELYQSISKSISAAAFWPKQLEKTNQSFQQKYNKWDSYNLFDENIRNIDSYDIDRYALPVFTLFVEYFFINHDKRYHRKLHNATSPYIYGEDHSWYRSFLDSFRSVPSWYTYDHDVLLLELALRNGLDTTKIIEDLDGDKSLA